MQNPLQEIRVSARLSRTEIARAIDVPYELWQGHESGRFPWMRQSLIRALRTAGYPAEDLARQYDTWRHDAGSRDRKLKLGPPAARCSGKGRGGHGARTMTPIRAARIQAALSLEQAARLLRCAPSTLRALEYGRTPTFPLMVRLARFGGLHTIALLPRKEVRIMNSKARLTPRQKTAVLIIVAFIVAVTLWPGVTGPPGNTSLATSAIHELLMLL